MEARIRRIETNLESQRALVRTVCATPSDSSPSLIESNNHALTSRMAKTEKDLQESRSIVAQLRLRGEQRAARGRRAAAAAAQAQQAAAVGTSTPGSGKNTATSSGKSTNLKDAGQHTVPTYHNKRSSKLRVNGHSGAKKDNNLLKSPYSTATITAITPMDYHTASITSPSPPFYFTQSDSSSPVDFMNPSSNYYFPTATSYHNTTDSMTPLCNTTPSSVQAPFMMVGDWPLLNDLQPSSSSSTTSGNNSFVDPLILAAAEQGIAPPLLSVSSAYLVDEETSIMVARARSLSHLPQQQQQMMTIPGLQPSTSSTSTCSNNSSSFSHCMYNTTTSGGGNNSFAQFMVDNATGCGAGNNSDNSSAMIMMDQQMR